MPLNQTGKKIKRKMKETYGEDADRVFFSLENKKPSFRKLVTGKSETIDDLINYIVKSSNPRKLIDHVVSFQGVPVAVEFPKGSYKPWTDKSGITHQTKQLVDYGFILRSAGADGESIDCYLCGDQSAKLAYIIRQAPPDMEDKICLGAGSIEEARKTYLDHHSNDESKILHICGVPVMTLKTMLDDPRHRGTFLPCRTFSKQRQNIEQEGPSASVLMGQG